MQRTGLYRLGLVVFGGLLALAGCDGGSAPGGADLGDRRDGGLDAGPDRGARPDAAADLGPDATPNAPDGAPDAAPDLGPDAAPDEGTRCEAGAPCDTGALGDCGEGRTECNADGSLTCVAVAAAGDERCGGGDEDCDGQTDEGFDVGAECAVGLGDCQVVGQVRCDPDGAATCAPLEDAPGPEPEACNGRDEDCDGAVDEDFGAIGEACAVGVGGCATPGVFVCAGEGGSRCDAVAGEPADEVCDGIDNDCDGATDERPGGGVLNERCYGGPEGTRGVGACQAGTRFCVDGAWGPCDGEVQPQPETCNNRDDDCNRLVDDDAGGPLLQGCYGGPEGTAGVGQCRAGEQRCAFGEWGACEGEVLPGNEICDQADNDCDGQVEEGLPGGCACEPNAVRDCYSGADGSLGVGACVGGTQTCAADGTAWGPCVGERAPRPEQCDQADDDCDGRTDEAVAGVGEACTLGLGACARPGVRVCDAQGLRCDAEVVAPTDEVCDGQDNDCDGSADEGYPVGEPCEVGVGACTSAGVTACAGPDRVVCDAQAGAPVDEVCNGLDDDCDGFADETYRVGRACVVGQGACRVEGVRVCGAQGQAVCGAVAGAPQPEACNQRDDDCDGAFDEGLGLDLPCTAGQGACARQGVRICGPGGAVTCSAVAAEPAAEVCNGVDDDCDGVVDDGVPDAGVCASGLPGVCRVGRRQCLDGERACVAQVQPSDEVCNGLDDDCDGQVDEDTGRVVCGRGICARERSACTDGAPTVCGPQLGAQDQELCNGLDDDCDGAVDEQAAGDGQPCGNGVGACQRPGVGACVDGALACDAAPGEPGAEACNGLDDDCDGLTDEGAVDPAQPCTVGVGACGRPGVAACSDGSLDCVGQAGAPAAEQCNAVDDDCDGLTDEGFGGQVCGQGVCRRILVACDGGAAPACDPLQGAQPEVCDGLDNDCDGRTDEDPADIGEACQAGQGLCRADGLTVCVGGELVCGAGQAEPAPEACNGLDDDCDGVVDEDPGDAGAGCTAGAGACEAAGNLLCVNGALRCDAVPGVAQAEACNATDDDCDGSVDEGLGTVLCGQGACERPLPACVDGAPPACDPAAGAGPEACNGTDDDCDGAVDEAPSDVGGACRAGLGVCAADGVQVCEDGALRCQADRGEPQRETCNGADDDCDGAVDEDFGVGQACEAGQGACAAAGVVVCQPDGTAACDGEPGEPAPEVCDGQDDDCDGQTDEGTADQPCDTGQLGTCAAGRTACVDGAAECVRQAGPTVEVCDGLDNNCNGQVDDNLGFQPCGVGACARDLPACVAGQPTACDPREGASPELCNGVDDDCDGRLDEQPADVGLGCADGEGGCRRAGLTGCVDGAPQCGAQAGAPTPELCNGVDDDCDGLLDEAPAGLTPCTVGVGVCAAASVRVCEDGALVCPAQAAPAGDEICNGLDDDCDGALDEGFGSVVCGVGQCRKAVPNCDGGAAPACDPLEGAEPERCDGVDNDCDGVTDEGVPGLGAACGAGEGACRADGVTACLGGVVACDAQPAAPSAEQCNGVDDDCDGAVDEQPAGVGAACVNGQGACAVAGLRVCQQGRLACDAVPLPPGPEVCDGVDNDCDGLRDEALGTLVCGEGVCRQVVPACLNGQPTECQPDLGAGDEVCNGFDDDCDGAVDEGFGTQACGQGACARQLPVCEGGVRVTCDPLLGANPETCNGVDDDCDGATDEEQPVQPCTDGVGACRAQGQQACVGGETVCDAQPGQPAAETCDGVDNDCDGATDEAPLVDVGGPCEAGVGACRVVAATVCQAAEEVCPAQAGLPDNEVCDGVDNDCDGATDEGGPDCDGDGVGDACELALGQALDCNGNGVPDACDLAGGASEDCNGNGVPDECPGPGGPDGDGCGPDVTPPVVELFVQGNVVNAGTVLQVRVLTPQPDESGIAERGLTLDGVAVPLDAEGEALVPLPDPGFRRLVGFAVDGAGNRGEASQTVRVLDPDDVDAPVVQINRPANGADVEGVVPFVITVNDENLVSWQLTWGPQGDPLATLLAEGDQPVAEQPVAQLDTAGLAVGRYDVRLQAEDVNGRGVVANSAFVIDDCVPQPELCDGQDNDCDGAADEAFPGLNQPCALGEGVCRRVGTLRCLNDFSGALCDAVVGEPSDELCNGLDDDCDGVADEDWPVAQACAAGVGECRREAALVCTADASGVRCPAVAGQPIAERCDGLDNDCDGDLDEGLLGCGVDQPPTVRVVANPLVVAGPGEPVQITVVANDDTAVVFTQLTVDGQPVALDAGGQATVAFDRPGLFTLVAVARDEVGQEARDTLVVRVQDPQDGAAPAVVLLTPSDNQVVDREIAVRGEVLDDNLAAWRLTYGPVGDSTANLLAQGDTPVAGELGRFRPELAPEGLLDLQLEAEDVNGQFGTATRRIIVRRCAPAPEACDGGDNDCDGAVDEGLAGCAGDQEAPVVVIQAPGQVNLGAVITVRVIAQDNLGVVQRQLVVNDQVVPLDAAGEAELRVDLAGRWDLQAVAADAAGNVGTAQAAFRVPDPDDRVGPVVEVASPASGAVLREPTPVVATLTATHVWTWQLTQGPANNPTQTVVATGTTEVANAPLGLLDTDLPPGDYAFRIVLEDVNGRTASATSGFTILP